MRLALNCTLRLLVFVVVLSFSSQGLALLDVNAKGTTADRKDLKLLYTFDEAAGATRILNQVNKNNLSHPTHLLIKGKRSNLEISGGSINFKNNSVLNSVDRRYVASDVGSVIGTKTVTLDGKKAIARSEFNDAVYLESQGVVQFGDICTGDQRATLHIFFKPKKINYASSRANIFRLQNPASNTGSLTLVQEFVGERLWAYIDTSPVFFRPKDLDFSGVQNEALISVSPNKYLDKYFLLHSEVGKEGWESTDTSRLGPVIKKINSYAGSKILLGTAALKKRCWSNKFNKSSGCND